jgi:hypothetical protein
MQEQSAQFDFSQEYAHQTELHGLEGRPCSFGEGVHYGPQWAILNFDQPVTAPHVSTPVRATTFASLNAYTSSLPILSAVDLSCSSAVHGL